MQAIIIVVYYNIFFRYLNKLEHIFLQKVNNIEKMINSQIAVTVKKEELIKEYDQLVPKLKLIQQKNKQLITEVNIIFIKLLLCLLLNCSTAIFIKYCIYFYCLSPSSWKQYSSKIHTKVFNFLIFWLET